MNKERQVQLCTNRIQKAINEGKVLIDDISKVDITALVDSSISYTENLECIYKQLGYVGEINESDYEEVEKEHIHDIENHYEEEFRDSVARLQGGEQNEMFSQLRSYVEMVGKAYSTALIVEGVGGIGKTYEVLKTLGGLGVDYEYINSYSTPLQFYNMLYEKRDSIIVLDDFEGIMKNVVGISILKSALWSATDKRIVSYHTTSDKLTVPSKFEFTGRIIFCLNSMSDNVEIRALRTRALHYRLDFTTEELKKIIMSIAKSDDKRLTKDERVEIAEFILENSNEASKELNLRTLIKAYGVYEYAKAHKGDWKHLLKQFLEYDEDKLIVKEVCEEHTRAKEQARAFSEKSGKSRRTFFTLKKQMGLCKRYS